LTGVLIVLVPALLLGLGVGLLLLAQQAQSLQAQLDESRAHTVDLQTELDRRDDDLAELRALVEELQAQVEVLTQQVRDAGLEPIRATSPENEAAMDAIEQQVQAIRGLNATRTVTRTLLTSEELREYVVELQEKNYSRADARDDALSLAALDLLEPDFELYDFIVDLYSEQIAGFYDPDTDQLYVIAEPGDLSALERITFAHEFDHALQDQHFDLEALGFSNDKARQLADADRQLAHQALVEGDGVLLMQLWGQDNLSAADRLAMTTATPATPVFNTAPRIFREQLLFPYLNGSTFVLTLQARGDWQAVDAAFENPPVSSEQIIHPERYPDDRPIPITLPPLTNTLPSGWRIVDETTLGEFMLRQYLTEHLDSVSTVNRAANGWGGDRYAVYVSAETYASAAGGFEYVLVISQAWDSTRDADEFAQAYREYLSARFDLADPTRTQAGVEWWVGPETTYFAQNGDRTLIVAGSDEGLVQNVLDTIAP
jgi:hypothetical protein